MPVPIAEMIADTFEILEALRPLYPDTPQGKKQVARLQTKLGAYFRSLRKTFPTAKTLATTKRHPFEESVHLQEATDWFEELHKEFNLVFQKWLDGERGPLEAVLQESIAQSSADGFTGGLEEWIDKYKLKVPPVGLDALVPSSLVKWTEDYAATLVKGLNEETARQLAGVIARGMEEQRGIPGITRDIKAWADESLVDMSKRRAETIARTETNNAFSEGNAQAAEAVGSQEKEWIKTSDYDCDICGPNDSAGRIKIDDSFPSGDAYTPGHPNCTCDVAYYGATKLSTEKAIGS